MRPQAPMVVDCETCPVRHVRCDDCLVTALEALPFGGLEEGQLPLDSAERRAVGRLVAAGLVSAEQAATVTARREAWPPARAVG
jgi:hypothetical protein